MLSFFGKEYDFASLTRMSGDFSQVVGAKRYAFMSGRSKGVEAVDIKTGTGLHFTVLLDRALDIAWAEYKGIPLAYMAQPGIVSSQYYNPEGNEWLRSFTGGLMTTCGLSNAGEAAELHGTKYGQHGRIANLPGENIAIEEEYDGTDYLISVKGKIKQVKAFFEHLVLHRTIRAFAGRNSILIGDVIENKTAESQPLMLLYHFNFGFPLINERSEIIIPHSNMGLSNMPYSSHEDFEEQEVFNLSYPGKAASDQGALSTEPFLFTPVADENGQAYFFVSNDRDDPALALLVTYDCRLLTHLIVWKCLSPGNYVLCIEPANTTAKGIGEEHRKGTLEYFGPFEKRESNIEIRVLDNKEEILQCRKLLRRRPPSE